MVIFPQSSQVLQDYNLTLQQYCLRKEALYYAADVRWSDFCLSLIIYIH